MFNWIFKKPSPVRAPAPPPAPARAPTVAPAPGPSAEERAEAKARQDAAAREEWLPRLHAARDDEEALLRVALDAPLLEIRLEAVQSLAGEAALKQAERALRDHDRRLHRAAKQRLDTAVARRVARARADVLLADAQALADAAAIAVNHLVALDRNWQALDAALLDARQVERFDALRRRIDDELRTQGEREQREKRWNADAGALQPQLRQQLADTAADGRAEALEPAIDDARQILARRPDGPATAALDAALQSALGLATALRDRLDWLAALDLRSAPCAEAPADVSSGADDGLPAALPMPEPVATDASPAPSPADLEPQWRSLPPLPDPALAAALDRRFEQWLREHTPPAPVAVPRPPVDKPRPAKKPQGPGADELARLDALLRKAEEALAEGQVGALQKHLQSIESAWGPRLSGVPAHDTRHARHRALLAERARLGSWREWGTGRARDELAAEAEALARRTLAASAAPEGGAAPKLKLQPHADAIKSMRARWKELDRLGVPPDHALWQRFDAALQIAHRPLADRHAEVKAAQQQNLEARHALLAALDARPELPAEDAATAFWKEQAHALERFRADWRKLGPVEHTAPPAERAELKDRLRSAVERIEAPLRQARAAAQAQREELIGAAEALAADLTRDPMQRDAAARMRELQGQWTEQARLLPLERDLEAALWTRFRTAIDGAIAQREAAAQARDAEGAAAFAARESLLQRLAGAPPDADDAAIRRLLKDVDLAWRQAPPLPRTQADAADARYRDARTRLLQRLDGMRFGRWQAQCDVLQAGLGLCEARERAGGADATLEQAWAAQPALPSPWSEALAQRWSAAPGPGPLATTAFDDLLLRLEAAYDVPPRPSTRDARSMLKLQAMKERLEGRTSAPPQPLTRPQQLAAAWRQSGLDPEQRERLLALVAALRQKGPDVDEERAAKR